MSFVSGELERRGGQVRVHVEVDEAVEVALGSSADRFDDAGAVLVDAGRHEVTFSQAPPWRAFASVRVLGGDQRRLIGERIVPFVGVGNFRDLGGYPSTLGGSTRWGVVYRADGLHRLNGEDLARYPSLGVRAVYDLRSSFERAREPDPVDSLHVPLEQTLEDPEIPDLSKLQQRIDGERRLRDGYLAMVESAGPMIGLVLGSLADAERLPAVVHSAGGKDRTGIVAALLLECLGVERETVLDDYELSRQLRSAERERPLLELFASLGMSAAAADGLLGSPRDAMRDALEAVDARHGCVEAYLTAVAGLEPATLERLRDLLIE